MSTYKYWIKRFFKVLLCRHVYRLIRMLFEAYMEQNQAITIPHRCLKCNRVKRFEVWHE